MASASQVYRKLPGIGNQWYEYCRLYLGPDHLLQVHSTGYSERYKRFYFRDIQAIAIHQSDRGRWWNWGLGLALVCAAALEALLILSFPNARQGLLISCAVLSVLLGIPLLVNNLLGPSCVTWVQTAAQTERLWAMNRVRRAERFLALIRPQLEAAQGQFGPEQWSALVSGLGLAAAPSPWHSPPVHRPAAQPAMHYASIAHPVLCWLLVTDLPVTALVVWLATSVVETMGMMWVAIVCIAAVVAIVKQARTDLPAGLKWIPWLCLAFNGFFFLVSVGYGIYLGMSRGMMSLERLVIWENPGLLALTVASTVVMVGMGIAGLVMWNNFQRLAVEVGLPPTQPPLV